MLVTMDNTAHQAATALKAWFDSAASLWLRLFTNDFQPTPGSTNVGAYVEANYTGYAQIALLGQWTAPAEVQPGVWQIQSGPWIFNANGDAADVTIRGWFLVRDGEAVLAELFPAAQVIQPGKVGPVLFLTPHAGDQETLCSS